MGLLQVTPKQRKPAQRIWHLKRMKLAPEAEGVGFEPTEPFWGSPLFESGTLNHSDTLPPGSIAQSPILPQAADDLLRSRQLASQEVQHQPVKLLRRVAGNPVANPFDALVTPRPCHELGGVSSRPQ